MANDDRRYPPNLRGLLAFCTDHTKSEDAASSSDDVPMSEERRNWLSEAIDSMQGTDPVKVMLEDVQVLLGSGETEDDIEKKQAALEDLQLHTEDIDLANDFQKIGGLHIVPMLLESHHVGLQWRAADLLATVAQNNPHCQKEILDLKLLPLLLKVLDDDCADDQVRIKSLYAISCLSREYPDAQEEFSQLDGFSVLIRAMQSNVEKLQIKSAFLMSVLCQQQSRFKDILFKMGMVDQLVGLLSMEHSSFHEQLVTALYHIVSDNEKAQLECQRPEFSLKSVLTQRKLELAGKDEYEEELDYVCRLYDLCFKDSSAAIAADR